MHLKALFSDKTFLVIAWPHLLGCINQGITTLALLIVLWSLSSSSVSFIEIVMSETGRIIKWSIFLVILFNLSFLFINLLGKRYYQATPPVGSTSSRASLQKIGAELNQQDRADQLFLKYIGPVVVLIIVVLDSFKIYFVDGGRGEALRPAITFVLPFTIALTIAHFSRVIVEVIILLIRYIIQLTNSRK